MDFLVVIVGTKDFRVERHHDKPDDWEGDKKLDGGLSPGVVVARVKLNTPTLQACTLDEWRTLILRNAGRLP